MIVYNFLCNWTLNVTFANQQYFPNWKGVSAAWQYGMWFCRALHFHLWVKWIQNIIFLI